MKNNNVRPIIFSVITFLLLMVLILCTVVTVSLHLKAPISQEEPSTESSEMAQEESGEDEVVSSVTEEKSSEGSEETQDPWLLQQGMDGGQSYLSSLTFLGDSTTYGLIEAGVLPDGKDTNQVWFGVTGRTITFSYVETVKVTNDRSDKEGMTIVQMAEKEKPEILVITLGVTGGVSSGLSKDAFTALYSKMIADIISVSPDTKIICNSIYPVCKSIDADLAPRIDNEKISAANKWILQVVKEQYKQGNAVYYLDSYSAIIGADGYLPENYSNGDGLHLSALAFQEVLSLLRTHKVPN